MKTPVRFRKISELVEGKYIRFQVATCGTCGREDRWRDSTQSAAPEEMVKRQFQRRGVGVWPAPHQRPLPEMRCHP